MKLKSVDSIISSLRGSSTRLEFGAFVGVLMIKMMLFNLID